MAYVNVPQILDRRLTLLEGDTTNAMLGLFAASDVGSPSHFTGRRHIQCHATNFRGR
jgi:hypothetical protein